MSAVCELTWRKPARFTARMRNAVVLILSGLCLMSGCSSSKTGNGAGSIAPPKFAPAAEQGIVAPENSLSGKVVKVNPNGRFVIINFPLGQMPATERQFMVYRRGLKVAEIRISGPRLDDNIVADVTAGEVEVGDVVREN
jgi:hypothetical protein